MVSALLLQQRFVQTAEDALDLFASRRTSDAKVAYAVDQRLCKVVCLTRWVLSSLGRDNPVSTALCQIHGALSIGVSATKPTVPLEWSPASMFETEWYSCDFTG